MAFGVLHMSPEAFWDMEPSELTSAIRGYYKEKESVGQGDWEKFRMLATTLVNLQVKKPLKAKELWPFEWEKQTHDTQPAERHSKEQLEAMKKRLNLK
jgi:hypothetical protein